MFKRKMVGLSMVLGATISLSACNFGVEGKDSKSFELPKETAEVSTEEVSTAEVSTAEVSTAEVSTATPEMVIVKPAPMSAMLQSYESESPLNYRSSMEDKQQASTSKTKRVFNTLPSSNDTINIQKPEAKKSTATNEVATDELVVSTVQPDEVMEETIDTETLLSPEEVQLLLPEIVKNVVEPKFLFNKKVEYAVDTNYYADVELRINANGELLDKNIISTLEIDPKDQIASTLLAGMDQDYDTALPSTGPIDVLFGNEYTLKQFASVVQTGAAAFMENAVEMESSMYYDGYSFSYNMPYENDSYPDAKFKSYVLTVNQNLELTGYTVNYLDENFLFIGYEYYNIYTINE